MSKVICIVDDQPALLQMLRFALSFQGVTVVAAVDGADAFEKISTQHIDMLITDWQMPVMDGVEAVAYLQKKREYEDKPTPDLILLDLNLPKWGGKQVLEKIKKDDKLLRIPVVVLTTSNASADVLESYDLHANCFINKPVDFDSFFQIISCIQQFWLQTATLPGSAS